MSSRYIVTIAAVICSLMLFMPIKALSQIIKPTGVNSRASSQLVYYFDDYIEDSEIQVTNTNDTQGVWIHVQIFRSFDADGSDVEASTDKIICDERDFVDFLTPNDTHVYNFWDFPFEKNAGETETTEGDSIFINLEGDGSSGAIGFAIITPVVSESDFTAISFQHLIGSVYMDAEPLYWGFNAMGRDAVDFTSGDIVADNTPLDGTTNGFIVLQPGELDFSFSDVVSQAYPQIIGIAFRDSYGPAGLLGYNVLPADVTWTSFIYDYKEDPTSCGVRTISCFDNIGLEENNFSQGNDLLGTDYLCSGVDLPGTENDSGPVNGWARLFVSGLGDFVNHIGFYGDQYQTGAKWMITK